ncbi:MAG: phosphatase PAP2 family protein [Saprospiraceae bacterium]
MFQTEINHFLQSFATDGLTTFMQLVTAIGYQGFFMIFLLFMLFVVNFKKAFLLFLILLWTGAVTFALKNYFNLPRPFHVDNTLLYLDGDLGEETTLRLSKKGAKSFWENLSLEVLMVTRQSPELANGFPSGHTSVAIAFWGAFAFLYRRKWIAIVAGILMILIPLSRMYLGVHFLADVLGGIVLGGGILAVFYSIVLKPQKLAAFLKKNKYQLKLTYSLATLLILPLLLFFLLPLKAYILVAFLLSFGLGFLLLARNGLPEDEGTFIQKILRFVLGGLIFGGTIFFLKMITERIGLYDNSCFQFVINFMAGLAMMWISIEISIRFGWYKRKKVDTV